MEVEVRRVPGTKDCYAALPLQMIEALQEGCTHLLSFVTLELRHRKQLDSWYLPWAGAASSSPSCIEVSNKLAECIGLSDGLRVSVKAQPTISHAKTVVLEPASEDDWEILELNAEFVESHILSQVGVLCSGQLFPIWVQGDNVLTFKVLSTTPKPVVRLVPGAELIVSPKPRRKISQMPCEANNCADMCLHVSKAWLRVQELHSSLAVPTESKSFKCLVFPTTAVFISPETAKSIPFKDGQQVIVASTQKEGVKHKEDHEKKENLRSNARSSMKGNNDTGRMVVLCVVHSDVVTRGHVMIASTLRAFLGVAIHTYVEVKSFVDAPSMVHPLVVISPFDFKTDASIESGSSANNHNKIGQEEALEFNAKAHENGACEWDKHKRFFTLVTTCLDMTQGMGDVENEGSQVSITKGEGFFRMWALAQITAVGKYTNGQHRSIPIYKETFMQFALLTNLMREQHLNLKNSQATTLSFLLSLHNHGDPALHSMNSEDIQTKHLGPFDGVFLFNEQILERPFKVKMGQPVHIDSLLRSKQEKIEGSPHLASLKWLNLPASEALNRLRILLTMDSQVTRYQLGLPSPGYVLLHGPTGSGKTRLALALARELEEDPSILAHTVVVKCREIEGERIQSIRSTLQDAISKALKHAPSLVVIDDLDAVIPASANPGSNEPSSSAVALAEFFSDLVDDFQACGRNQHGGIVVFLAVSQAVSSLPPSICASGRFDFHVALPTPIASERAAIIVQELDHRNLTCDPQIISGVASKCDSYDTSDLEILVDRAVHAAAPRLLSSSNQNEATIGGTSSKCNVPRKDEEVAKQNEIFEQTNEPAYKERREIIEQDFVKALVDFYPVAMRDIARPGDKAMSLTWKDIGGLSETCQALKEMLELPVKYTKIFSNAPLRLRTGVLLYGPPGCGKTHIVGVAAAACSLRLISVKGPELLNKYIGASEQGVRDIFARATAAAPCILFFDEFDAIAPKRGHDNTGVTDRVVNQLLTELDGVEALHGVFVFAATSRPDLLDSALLRPGRLDRLLLCDFPTARERLEILQVLSRKLPLSNDVNLDLIASMTENFSGADLQAVLSDAQLEAVHSFLDQPKAPGTKLGNPIITMDLLRSVLLKARPSVSESERRRLHSLYNMFVSSRSSIAKRDQYRKGKRATLA